MSQDIDNENAVWQELVKLFQDTAGIKPQEMRGELRKIIKDIAMEMLPLAANRIGIEPSDLKKRLSIELNRGTDINAYTNKSGNRIIVNDSLMIFYHKMLKVFAATLSVGDKTTGIIRKPVISPKTILSVTIPS
jgi:hypothetical protein